MKTIKSLPAADLKVVAMLYLFSDVDGVDAEYEVWDEEMRASAKFEKFAERCDCCGQKLKWACEVVHAPTKTGYFVGRSCALKIDALSMYKGGFDRASVAMLERVACKKREAAYRAAHPEANAALDWAASPQASRIAVDLLAKLRRWGPLSDAQLDLLLKLHQQNLDRRALAANSGAKCPVGRVELQGTIVSLKDSPVPARHGGEIHSWKMVVDLGNGVKVWGSLPEALHPSNYNPSGARLAAKGDRIKFVATVTPSQNDPLFGFFKMPKKAELLPLQLATSAT